MLRSAPSALLHLLPMNRGKTSSTAVQNPVKYTVKWHDIIKLRLEQSLTWYPQMEDRPNFVNMELKAAEGETNPSARMPARPAVVVVADRIAAPYKSGGPFTSSVLGVTGLGG